ncbi:hypothetical protein OIU76_025038 [Salix suchowensis]|nr:hypothetical protein OIU76_025038 [Salix suchowensis]
MVLNAGCSHPQHSVAWDVGTGNGQAAISVAEVYEKVIATDISDEQLKQAIPHPQVKFYPIVKRVLRKPGEPKFQDCITMLQDTSISFRKCGCWVRGEATGTGYAQGDVVSGTFEVPELTSGGPYS